jgi:hypothetical protein
MKRCPQCWQERVENSFVNRAGYTVKRCHLCRRKYAGWAKMTDAQKMAATSSRSGLVEDGSLRVRFVAKSANRKTGPIPVTMSSAGTCPPSCSFYGAGCYAEQHLTGHHWRTLSDGSDVNPTTGDWSFLCASVRELPEGQLWRHNEAGDLPGRGPRIDGTLVFELVLANKGRKGFSYTHKPMLGRQWERGNGTFNARAKETIRSNRGIVMEANREGFTVNLSADSLEEADALAEVGPVVVTVPHDAPRKGLRTPKGRHVVICPATEVEGITCASCGLCAVAKRKSVVGFRAHGNNKYQVTTRIRQLPLFQEERP